MSQGIHIIASDQKTKAILVPELGGWVSSLELPFASGVREILFQHDYAWRPELKDLRGGLPFLFPVCARVSRNNQENIYLYDGKQYELWIHGFSAYEKWAVDQVTDNSIEMVLRDNENTLKRYPFRFEVRLKYEVQPGKLICYQTYQNNEPTRDMPYYAGFHPYFRVSGQCQCEAHCNGNCVKEKTVVNFSAVRRLRYNETLTDIVGEQAILPMPSVITNPDINEQLSVLDKNKAATLTFSNGEAINIHITQNPDYFPYLQLYTIPEKPFFCVEHWMGFPNAMNTVSGVRWLKPNAVEMAVYEIRLG